MRGSLFKLLGAGSLAMLVGCAATPKPAPARPVVEVPAAPSAEPEPERATRAPAPKAEKTLSHTPAGERPPEHRGPEPRQVVAGRVLAELADAHAEELRQRKLEEKKLQKAMSSLHGQGLRGVLGGGAAVGGFSVGRNRGSGSGLGAGGVGIGGLGVNGRNRTHTSLKLLSHSGPLSGAHMASRLRSSLAVRFCDSGSAWATFEIEVDKGGVTRARVISSHPATAKFKTCVGGRLSRLRFLSKPGKTVVRATLRVTRLKP